MAEVKHAGAAERIADRHYMLVVYDNHGLIVEADNGATRIVPLDAPAPNIAPDDALADSARRTADRWGVPVVYMLDYPQWQPGDPIAVPD